MRRACAACRPVRGVGRYRCRGGAAGFDEVAASYLHVGGSDQPNQFSDRGYDCGR